ncbi:L-2-hydroxyglutarate oxidase [Terribacillus halophilus]|uniref:L-2-hydroxyglutarate oxidase n=1 Tax=Terribacillus halophilus TaxID=361279 RepID=A0A1G6IX20_9BACI|nr:L-2-hydroxyglutarate oxidase [Terribacillus halophilus]SDC11029.1 L-2-hydroxyglutarate oxidase [Terribacillus halophilus]
MYDIAIVGGGIVGLATAYAILQASPDRKVVILEKEPKLALHQTGHNSGVIHSGIYYKPGSFKAAFAKQGSESMLAFCREADIEVEQCGKVIVATKDEELQQLEQLFRRGLANGLAIEKIDACRLQQIEPYANGLAAIRVPQAGIVNYKQVCHVLAERIQSKGGIIKLGCEVVKIEEKLHQAVIHTKEDPIQAGYVINCAGLHSDRVAKAAGLLTDTKIIPFRGEYYELKPQARHYVKHLIYPVPDPAFPFLGVHFTRMIGGGVEAGPNAVLGFKREAYRKRDVAVADVADTLRFPGFWKLAGKYYRQGAAEYLRSFFKSQFVKSLQELIPAIDADDLEAAPAGVRAQALQRDGRMVDDFQLIRGKRTLHVCNAPSPAATASLEIGKSIWKQAQ